MIRPSRRVYVGAVLVSLTLVSACTTPDKEATTSIGLDALKTVGDDPKITVRSLSINHLISETGTLSYNPQNKCLELSTSAAVGLAVVWPANSMPINQHGRRGVRIPDVGDIFEGDTIAMVGGHEEWVSPPPFGYSAVDAVECLEKSPAGLIFVVGVIEHITQRGRSPVAVVVEPVAW